MRQLLLNLNQQYGITILVSSHILDELSRLATHYGFIDNGKMIKEISADDLENSFRKSIRIEVTDGKALAAVLKQTGQPYKMPAPNVAEIYHRLNISQLTSALEKYHCDLLSIQEQEENLESYYVDLIGGVSMSRLLVSTFIRMLKKLYFGFLCFVCLHTECILH